MPSHAPASMRRHRNPTKGQHRLLNAGHMAPGATSDAQSQELAPPQGSARRPWHLDLLGASDLSGPVSQPGGHAP